VELRVLSKKYGVKPGEVSVISRDHINDNQVKIEPMSDEEIVKRMNNNTKSNKKASNAAKSLK
jgi:hypothetical protein